MMYDVLVLLSLLLSLMMMMMRMRMRMIVRRCFGWMLMRTLLFAIRRMRIREEPLKDDDIQVSRCLIC